MLHELIYTHNLGMDEVVKRFDQVRRGQVPAADPLQLVEAPPCNGYWYGKPGMDLVGA